MSKLKIGQSCYKLDNITGSIIETTYGGHDWLDDLGLIQPTKHDLQLWISTIRNENKRRNNES